MNWNQLDWDVLSRLRARFLDGSSGGADYWTGAADLAAYDETFGRRIGWKWDYVLVQLAQRAWRPPAGTVLDWACGTGVAARRLLRHFGAGSWGEVTLWDRSPLATQFAVDKIRGLFPAQPVRTVSGAEPPPATLLVSHVLTELTAPQREDLLNLAAGATAILWIEPGTHQASRELIAVGESLRGQFHVVAPCTHGTPCPMLSPGNERHWCHHFAPSPPEVHTDGDWVRFGRLAGIDLRSLPLSYLVLDKRPAPPLPPAARILGRPRLYKAWAMLLACDEAGLTERRLMKRHCPDFFRRIKKDDFDTLQSFDYDGIDIVAVQSKADGAQ